VAAHVAASEEGLSSMKLVRPLSLFRNEFAVLPLRHLQAAGCSATLLRRNGF
jgi:hypothetical protein